MVSISLEQAAYPNTSLLNSYWERPEVVKGQYSLHRLLEAICDRLSAQNHSKVSREKHMHTVT